MTIESKQRELSWRIKHLESDWEDGAEIIQGTLAEISDMRHLIRTLYNRMEALADAIAAILQVIEPEKDK